MKLVTLTLGHILHKKTERLPMFVKIMKVVDVER